MDNYAEECKPRIFMDDEWFRDWYVNASDDEIYLFDRVCEFEEILFSDMLFSDDSFMGETLKSVYGDEKCNMDPPYELAYFQMNFFHFTVEEETSIDVLGHFDRATQTLNISPKALKNDTVIIHELIHLHEYVLNSVGMYYHDVYFWYLYRSLRERIPDLEELIDSYSHMAGTDWILKNGGEHDLLFYCKSLDLDLKLNCELGTVFGYGEAESISETKKTI